MSLTEVRSSAKGAAVNMQMRLLCSHPWRKPVLMLQSQMHTTRQRTSLTGSDAQCLSGRRPCPLQAYWLTRKGLHVMLMISCTALIQSCPCRPAGRP